MSYDYSQFEKAISETFGTRKAFAEAMGLSERSLSLKMTKKRQWKQAEMEKACEIMGKPRENILAYFFTLKIQCRTNASLGGQRSLANRNDIGGPFEVAMNYVQKLYGITRLEWDKVRFVIERSFEEKEREARKTTSLSSDDDIIDPF